MNELKFLVAGCGSIGLRHLGCLESRKDVNELHAFDVNGDVKSKVKEISDRIAFHDNLDDALAISPDITVVCVPNSHHMDTTLKAFQAGSHVLCEKPIADTVEDGTRMVEAAREHGKVLSVGYTMRFHPGFEHILSMVNAGELGNVIGGRALIGTYNTLLCAKTDFRSRVFGVLLVDYTHEIDMLRAIFGEARDVVCKANSIAKKPLTATPSLASLLIEYESDAIASVHMDYVQHPQRRILEVFGDKRAVEFDMQTDLLKVFDCEEPGYRTLQFDNPRDDRFTLEHQDIIDAMATGSSPRVTGEDAVEALKVAENAISQLANHAS